MSTPIAVTGTTTAASTTVTALSSLAHLLPGQAISGAGIPSATTIVSISRTSLVLSAAATAAATVTLTVALVGFTAFVANNIQDASGLPLALGSMLVQPTDNNNLPITASSGGLGGQMIVSAATIPITAGSVGAGAVVADTSLTSPVNISFRITILDPQGRTLAVYKGVQPTGATFDFDTFTPNVPAQAPYTEGPPGTDGTDGTNGTNGAAGAAGSEGSVTTLAASVLPAPGNLFNIAAAQENFITNSVGAVVAQTGAGGGPSWVSNLMYCPGATELVANYPLGDNGFGPGAYIQLFDANGDFLSVLASMGSWNIAAGTAITLPGTQVYVRVTLLQGVAGGPPTFAMFYAGTSTPTIPGAFTSFAPYVSTAVDANIAAAAASVKGLISQGDGGLLGLIIPENANVWDASAATVGSTGKDDGTLYATSYFSGEVTVSGFILCPGVTAFTTNATVLPDNFDGIGESVCIQLFDAEKNYLGNTASAGPATFTSIALPGTQTYMRITIDGGPGTVQGSSPAYVMVFLAKPGAAVYAMSAASPWTPFYGKQVINGFARATVKTGSGLGCYMNGANDDTALLQAFLNTASATNPIELILDGVAATTGLYISPNGYTSIRGLGVGTGLILISLTFGVAPTQDVLRIGPVVPGVDSEGSAGTPPARTAVNIMLRDFQINPNGQVNAVQPTYGVILTSCAYVLVDNLSILGDCANYCLCLSNAGNVKISRCNFVTGGQFHDGIHIDGPSEDINISDCYIATGDDGIALNAHEGYGGNISDVAIANCVFNGAATLMRAYGSAAGSTVSMVKVSSVTVTGCTGSVTSCVASLGLSAGGCNNTNTDEIEDITFSNNDIVHGLSGQPYAAFLCCCNVRSLAIHGHTHHPVTDLSLVHVYGYQTDHILIDGLTIVRGPEASATCGIVDVDATAGGSMTKLTIRGVTVVDQTGSSYAAMPYALSVATALAELVIDALDIDKFTSLFDSNGTANITAIKGAGLLGTGASVPDSVVANDALYLSSTDAGALSIKLAGTAMRFTL
jgi:hypothetical protein